MTTKSNKTAVAKAVSVAVNGVRYTQRELWAVDTAKAVVAVGNMTANINELCGKIHKSLKGSKLGTVKSNCAEMIRFNDTLIAEKPSLADSSRKNMLTAFRTACNEGVPFSMNAYRKTASKGASGSKSEETKPAVKLTIVKDSTAEQVAQGLRLAVNDKKFRETYSELAAFLVDALDEYEGV